jgi:hypothetical protein
MNDARVSLPPLSVDEHDEDVRIAVRALGDMRSGLHRGSVASTCELLTVIHLAIMC